MLEIFSADSLRLSVDNIRYSIANTMLNNCKKTIKIFFTVFVVDIIKPLNLH